MASISITHKHQCSDQFSDQLSIPITGSPDQLTRHISSQKCAVQIFNVIDSETGIFCQASIEFSTDSQNSDQSLTKKMHSAPWSKYRSFVRSKKSQGNNLGKILSSSYALDVLVEF